MDEGWTRLVLDEFGFDYDRITSLEKLEEYDIFIIPEEISADLLINGSKNYPLKNGMGEEGLGKIGEFLNSGGRVIMWGAVLRSSSGSQTWLR